ncbi:hypothetical protein [Olsenella sp. Marseille-P4559]|uniref:hypothetical protein n=1 Tax=Olsenella sp. Marseille-P4559 TaxID=2364795 RepID=UPI001030AF86|nr:hypothetical protein [Olsenella sp. Marseille-P4559]
MYSDEDRRWAPCVLSETGTFSETARVTGISRGTVARWAQGDDAAGASRKGIVLHTTTEKLAALAMPAAGAGVREVAGAFDVIPQATGNRGRRMEGGGLGPETPGEQAREPREDPREPAAPPAGAPRRTSTASGGAHAPSGPGTPCSGRRPRH